MSKKWKWISILSSVVLTFVIAGAWLLSTATTASAAEITAEDLQTLTQSATEPGLLGEGYLAHGGWGRGGRGSSIDALRLQSQQLLADALGITVEQLQEAYETARLAAIEQAVEHGIITQEEADEMAAKKETAEALQSYLGRDVLLAQALDMTVEELDAAYAEGKSLSDLLSEAGLDAATVRENLQAAREAALAQAVEDGVISQEQADEMSERMPMSGGPGMRGPGGRGGVEGRGGPGGMRPQRPDADGAEGTDEGTGGARFRPGRTTQDDSAL